MGRPGIGQPGAEGRSTLRLGIIGAGRAGRARMRAINERPDLELVGVASSQEDVRTHTIDDLLGSDADAIVVCTINSAHAKQVSAALAAGKHVLCEYPLA